MKQNVCLQASGYPSWGQAELSVAVCHPGYLYQGLRLASLSNLAHGEIDSLQKKSERLSRTVNNLNAHKNIIIHNVKLLMPSPIKIIWI